MRVFVPFPLPGITGVFVTREWMSMAQPTLVSNKKTIRVLIVVDHAMVGGALASYLEMDEALQIVGNVSDAERAVALAATSRPDVVLMEIGMPGLDPFEATRRILANNPQTKMLFLSEFLHDRAIGQGLAVKGHGFVTKMEQPEALIEAIHVVAAGGRYFSPQVRERIMIQKKGAKIAVALKPTLSRLTPRELEILRYVADGNSHKNIASTLSISVKTVETHCTNLMAKLGIHDRVGLAKFAIREGISLP